MRLRTLVLLALAALVAAAPARAATKPSSKTLYADGPEGRYLLDGTWLFRLDPTGAGLRAHWERSRSSAGWKPVTVPNVWNNGDPSAASMLGGVGWYRSDFALPSASAALQWAVRFESVNYRSTVWLNGHVLGRNTGAFVPFQFDLKGLARRGTNRLVIRVDSRHSTSDFPVGGFTSGGTPTGGWWNYSGLQREVYLQRVDRVDFEQVVVRPLLPCTTCAARVQAAVTLRNVSGSAQRVSVGGSYGGQALRLRALTIPAGRTGTLDRQPADRATGSVVAGLPAPLRRPPGGPDRRPQGRRLRPAQRDPLDQGGQRPADAQRPAPEPARRRRARGLTGRRLRHRRRPPRPSCSSRSSSSGGT